MQHDHHVYTFYLFVLNHAPTINLALDPDGGFDISTEARDGWTYQGAYR